MINDLVFDLSCHGIFADKFTEIVLELKNLEMRRKKADEAIVRIPLDGSVDYELTVWMVEDIYSSEKNKLIKEKNKWEKLLRMNELGKEKWENQVKTRNKIDLDAVHAVPFDSYFSFQRIRKNSSGFVALCPLHKEATPSFHVFFKDNHAHCFGCGWHGDLIDFVMKMESCDFRHACGLILSSP